MNSGLKAADSRGIIHRVRADESGQGLVEYALIISIVSLGAVVALGFLSGKINGLFSKAGNSLNAVTLAADAAPGSGDGGGGSGSGGAPVVTIGQQPSDPTTSASATFRFTSSPAGSSYVCQVTPGPAAAPCSPGTDVTYTGLSIGQHTFTVTPTPAGTTDTYTWTINAPDTPPTSPNSISIQCSRHFSGDCDDNHGNLSFTTSGSWGGSPAPTLTYRWEQNGDSGASCSSSSGWTTIGTTASVASPSANGTDRIRITVTGTNSAGTATVRDCDSIS